MYVLVCKLNFSLEFADRKKVVAKIKDKVFAQFKIQVKEVGEVNNSDCTLAFVNLSKTEDYLRDQSQKIIDYLESSEGLRISEKIDIFYYDV